MLPANPQPQTLNRGFRAKRIGFRVSGLGFTVLTKSHEPPSTLIEPLWKPHNTLLHPFIEPVKLLLGYGTLNPKPLKGALGN